MNRRQFVQTSAAAALATTVEAGAIAAVAEGGAAPKAGRRPNILYVFDDEHRECSLPGKPHSNVIAPNIDAFHQANFTMVNCISNYPLCTPYRAILQSGRYPPQTGVVGNGPALPTSPTNLAQVFRKAGYHTGYVGKWHLDHADNHFITGDKRMGYEDWRMWCKTNDHYHSWTYDQNTGARINPEGWQPVPMTDEAIAFLGRQPKGEDAKPWFLVLSYNPPHPPFDPPTADASHYSTDALPFRPNIKVGVPLTDGKVNPKLQSMRTLRDAEQGYYGAITGIDEQFGRVLKALDASGFADNTIVVFTSDHGEMMGGHARMAKMVPFEESCHVPFFIRVPGKTKAGGASTELFAAIDIYPTLLGLAGIEVPSSAAGRDMSAVITSGAKAPETDGVILMCDDIGTEKSEGTCPTYRGIRTDTHTYAVAASGRWVLYDNVNDPFQMKNLIADPSQQALMADLDTRILRWQKRFNDKFDLKKCVGKISNEVS